MASTQTWVEFNGALDDGGTNNRTDADWKSVDDSTTAAASATVTAGDASFSKVQAVQFAGTWSELSGLTYVIDNASPASGLTITGAVLSADPRPNASTVNGDDLFSSALSANFVAGSDPWATGTASVSGGGTVYGQALRTQLQTTVDVGSGAIQGRTITATWTES